MRRGWTYLLFLQHHKVEMAQSLIGVLLQTFPECLFSDYFTDVLVNEVSAASQRLSPDYGDNLRCEIMRSTQAEPFLFRLYNVECRILLFRESRYQPPCMWSLAAR
jgi:hypothetical protein